MASFTDLGSLGGTGSTVANLATLVLTTVAAAEVGEFAVVVAAVDNRDSNPDADLGEVSGVTDSGGNTWTKAIGWTSTQGTAQAGSHVAVFRAVITSRIASGGTITCTFADAATSDAAGMTARHFSKSGATVAVEATATDAEDVLDPGPLNATTANIECLRIRGISGEVGNNTSLTPTSGWTAWANGNSATTGTTAEMCARAEHIISTGTGASSNPTWVACDNSSAYAAFSTPSLAIVSPKLKHYLRR